MGSSMNTPIGMGWFEWDEEMDKGDLSSSNFPPLGPYDNREVVSALRKSVKMARTEEAIWWLTVALECSNHSGGHLKYLGRQLWIMAGEDMFDQQIVLQAYAVYQMIGTCNETDHMYQLVYRMCEAEKVHESAGAEMDRMWGEAQGKMRNGQWRQVPSYAVDRHTYRGKSMMYRGERTDERFSGTDFGRMATRFLWRANGSLDPEAGLTEKFWALWLELKESYGLGKSLKFRKTVKEQNDEKRKAANQQSLLENK